MLETLLVCSKTTRKYLPKYSNVHIVTSAPKKQLLQFLGEYDSVLAIGGGAVIDTAKILSSNPITCYPTTAAGSSCTSHSVCWDGKTKMSIKRQIPSKVIIKEEYVKDLPEKIKEYTTYDAISHCLDSLWSINKNKQSIYYAEKALEILKGDYTTVELINAGNIAGKAIQICPTTILHSISYPLTAEYNIPHGKALGYLLPRICEYFEFDILPYIKYQPIMLNDINWKKVCKESLKYDKIFNVDKQINEKILLSILT